MKNTVILVSLLLFAMTVFFTGNSVFAAALEGKSLAQNEYGLEDLDTDQTPYPEDPEEYYPEDDMPLDDMPMLDENPDEYPDQNPDQYQDQYQDEYPDQNQYPTDSIPEDNGEYLPDLPDNLDPSSDDQRQIPGLEEPPEPNEIDPLTDTDPNVTDEMPMIDDELRDGVLPTGASGISGSGGSAGSSAAQAAPNNCAQAAGKTIFLLTSQGITGGRNYLKSDAHVVFSNQSNVDHYITVTPSGFFTSDSFTVPAYQTVHVKAGTVTQSTNGTINVTNSGNPSTHSITICP